MDLPDDIRDIAFRELNETQATRDISIERLKKLLENEVKSGLKCPTDAAFLLKFLRARKFDVDRAFVLLKNYYGYRSKHKKIYQDLLPSALRGNLAYNYQTVLPGRDREGRAILIVKSGLWNPYACKSEDIFRANVLCLEQAILDPVTQVTGIVAIMDMKGFGFTHVRFCPPSNLQKVVSLIQDCFPARFKAIHIVNEPAIFSMMFGIVRRLLNEKLQQRIHFHGCDMSSLHQFIPAEILPEEYGGFNGPMDNTDFVARLYRNDELFKKDAEYGYKLRVKG
ncbi:unnamed protein product [Ixodes hexagonus]